MYLMQCTSVTSVIEDKACSQPEFFVVGRVFLGCKN